METRDQWIWGREERFILCCWTGKRWASRVAPVIKNPPANAGDTRDSVSIPGSGRSPGGGNDNPLWYSCLENSMDRDVWQATVHMSAKSQTWLKWLSTDIGQDVSCLNCMVAEIREIHAFERYLGWKLTKLDDWHQGELRGFLYYCCNTNKKEKWCFRKWSFSKIEKKKFIWENVTKMWDVEQVSRSRLANPWAVLETEQDPVQLLGTKAFLCNPFLVCWEETPTSMTFPESRVELTCC